VKNFRIFFIVTILCLFTLTVSAQTPRNQKVNSTQLCQSQEKPNDHKTIEEVSSSTPPLTATKQRRLKSYHSNHKINRKRKTITAEHPLAIKD